MSGRSGVGEFEQLVMLVIVRLGSTAFAPDIATELEESGGRRVTRGALYSTLNRLEAKGFVDWSPEEPGPDRGGHIRRHFSVTAKGMEMLRERREVLLTLWDGIEPILDDTP